MLSLSNAFNEEDLYSEKKIFNYLNNKIKIEYNVNQSDGISASLTYINKKLLYGVSRVMEMSGVNYRKS